MVDFNSNQIPPARDSSFDADNVQDKKEEETSSLESTNCSCSCCLGCSSRKQKNHAFTLLDGLGSSSSGRAMKISNDTHFGDGWDSDFGDGWCISGRMDHLGGRVILRNKEALMVAAVLRQSRGYAILSTSPAYSGQPRRSFIHKKAMYPMATVSYKRSAFSSKFIILRHDTQTTYVADNCGRLFGTRVLRISEQDSGKQCGHIRHGFESGDLSKSRWQIHAGAGFCPCLMICFVATINKSLGMFS
jgi:hypothetical protein